MKEQGYAKDGDLAMLQALDTGEISIYDYKSNIPQSTVGEETIMREIGGFVMTFDTTDFRSLDQIPILKPIAEPMNKIMEKLKGCIPEPKGDSDLEISHLMPQYALKIPAPK